jgi:hypothetical protein
MVNLKNSHVCQKGQCEFGAKEALVFEEISSTEKEPKNFALQLRS